MAAGAGALPELEGVAWRRRADARSLLLRERISAAYTTLYVTPLIVVAAGMVWLEPFLFPVSALALVHAWVIPELFANRGAGVVRVPRGRPIWSPRRFVLVLCFLGSVDRAMLELLGLKARRPAAVSVA